MKIFLLDDSIRRLKRFRLAYNQHEIIHSASAAEAIEILGRESFDLICLDHDLVEHDSDWLASGSGYEVAIFLAEHDTPNKNTMIFVHTMNPEAGDRMMEVLKNRRVQRISSIALCNPQILL